MTSPLWLIAAWGWLKRNWKWLLLPIGALAWLLGRLTAKKTVVVESSALEEHNEVVQKIEEEADVKREAAHKTLEGQLMGIDSAHSAAVTASTSTVIKEAGEAQGDSDKVNDLLKNLGKDLRK